MHTILLTILSYFIFSESLSHTRKMPINTKKYSYEHYFVSLLSVTTRLKF